MPPVQPPPHPPPSGAALVLNDLHRFFMSFPVVCFILALLTDIAYWQTSFLMWHDFSSWLLFAGLVGGAIAFLLALAGLLFRPRLLSLPYWLGMVVVFALGIINSFYHAGDGWTAIVPTGLALSAVTVALMLLTLWLGRPAVRVRRAAYLGEARHA